MIDMTLFSKSNHNSINRHWCFMYNLNIFPKFHYVTTFGWSLVKMPSKNGWSTMTAPKFNWYLVRMLLKFDWPRVIPFEFNWPVVSMQSKFSWSSLLLRLVPSLPSWDASFKEKSCSISSNSIYWWAYALVWMVFPLLDWCCHLKCFLLHEFLYNMWNFFLWQWH